MPYLVTNNSGQTECLGGYKFPEGLSGHQGMNSAVKDAIEKYPGFKVEEVDNLPQPEELQPKVETEQESEVAGATTTKDIPTGSKGFQSLNAMTAADATKAVNEIKDQTLLAELASNAQFATVRTAADKRLKELVEPK